MDRNKTFFDFFISGKSNAANIEYNPILKLDCKEAGSISPH